MKVTATVVGYDDFLPPGLNFDMHEFHVVVCAQGTGRLMRLRARSPVSAPLRLEHFGAGADLDEIRDRLTLGALISFECMEVWAETRDDPNYHEIDVIVPHPSKIVRDHGASLVRGRVYQFPGMTAHAR